MMSEYVAHGFALCPIPPGSKGPNTQGWNSIENAVTKPDVIPFGHGCGLLHMFSGTMALDIDSKDHAELWLAGAGINLQELMAAPDAVQVISGRAGHGKLIFKMPHGLVLPSKQIKLVGSVALEFRCATANGLSVQDVLPPSIHPDTKQPYTWGGAGDWRALPMIPDALLRSWKGLFAKDAERSIHTGAPISANWQEVHGALECISPDCTHDEWRDVGFALHFSGTQTNRLEEAFHLWHDWSAKATVKGKYLGEAYMRGRWNTFVTNKESSVKLGTVFKLAKDKGWVRPPVDVTSLFKPTGSSGEPAPEGESEAIPDAPPPLNDPRRGDIIIPLDLSLVPPVLAQRSREVGESVGCDPAVPLWAGIAAVCGALDSRTTLKVDEKFTVRPILWLMTIGAPSDKKTPGSDPMILPLKDIEADDRDRAIRETRIWEAKEAIAIAAKKRYHASKSTPEALLETASGHGVWDDMPPELNLPPKPHQLQITVTDITSQALARICAAQPRGVLCHLDEMSSWMRKMADPKSGESRSTWVQAHGGGVHKVDRVADGAIHVENMAVSLYGNVQPRVFATEAKQLMSDGLLQRFLYVKLDGTKTSVGAGIPEWATNEAQWLQTLRLLAAMPATQYTLSDGAREVYHGFRVYADEVRQREKLLQSSDAYQEAVGKLVGQCARMALVWHAIESPWAPEVSAGLMERVVTFIRTTVMMTLRHVLDVTLGESSFDAWCQDHILARSDQPTISLSELKKDAGFRLAALARWDVDKQIFDAMGDLERVRWVARIDEGAKGSPVVWAINPQLQVQYAEHRDAVIRARQDRQREIYRDNPHPGSRQGKDVRGFDPERHGDPLY